MFYFVIKLYWKQLFNTNVLGMTPFSKMYKLIWKMYNVPMKKSISIDLDGTLLTSDYTITDVNRNAINEAIKQGWEVILATGKPFWKSKEFYYELGLNSWFICSHGRVVCKPKEDIFNYAHMNKDVIHQTIEKYKHLFRNYGVETMDELFLEKTDTDLAKSLKVEAQHISGMNDSHIIFGFYATLKDPKDFDKLEADDFDLAKWEYGPGENDFFVYFKQHEISKWDAVKKIYDEEGYDYLVSFGNGRSDISLLNNADEGYAMADSQQEVLKEVKNILPGTNNDSAVGHKIMEIIQRVK